MKVEIIDYGAVAKNHLPLRAHVNDCGADVFAPDSLTLSPGCTAKVGLGFGLKIPVGYAGFVFTRSSFAANGVDCLLPPIDPSYTGEVHAIITNIGRDYYYISKGDRIGQLVILPCVIADFVTAPLEARGANGFGSTGR